MSIYRMSIYVDNTVAQLVECLSRSRGLRVEVQDSRNFWKNIQRDVSSLSVKLVNCFKINPELIED